MSEREVGQARTDESVPGGWAGPAWEFLLPAVAVPVRNRGVSLVAALREAIREGRLVAGTRLPASRDLAADLGVSRGLVTEVYARLIAESYLVARPGAGTWVADVPSRAEGEPASSEAASQPGRLAELRFPSRDPAPEITIDFRPGVPAFALFPRAAWANAYQRAITTMPDTAFGYPDPRGMPELRAALAELLARRRGVAVHPDGLIVCAGVSQALTLLARVATARGHRLVAVEDPGSPPELPLLEDSGLTAVPVPVDADGVDLRALTASGARMFVGTPAHQFPTGIAYTPERRAALLAWSRENDGLIVEDDYDGEFRYDRAPVGALQGLAPDQVVYTGSVSKSLAPGLRLGWLVPPAALLADLVQAKRFTDLGNAAPDQAALADFIRTGRYDQHLRRCQRTYRERRDVLREALAKELPDVRTLGIAAGLHLIAQFPPENGSEASITARAARAGVGLHPAQEYATRRRVDGQSAGQDIGEDAGPARIVLGYANLTPRRITAGVEALARALRV